MQKYKSLVLPIALIAGFIFRQFCAEASITVPYVIFAILVLTFSGVKLSRLRPTKFDLMLTLFQTIVSGTLYICVYLITSNQILAEGAMICVLCPVASSVTVVASMLGANPLRTTTYTIIGNLLVAFIAPIYLSFIWESENFVFLSSFSQILLKIASVIALPYFIMFILQKYWQRANDVISGYKQYSFYLWAYALLVTIGQTADFVVERWESDSQNVVYLGIISLLLCVVQFVAGRKIGKRYDDPIAGGQLLGQKNSAIGIWMVNTFLNPVASVSMAFYSVWQNIFNSWQIYLRSKRV